MTWFKTFRQFLTLILGIGFAVGLIHGCLNMVGKSQEYTQLDHSVLKKINDSIYLIKSPDGYDFVSKSSNALPEEISSMFYLRANQMSDSAKLENVSSTCLFLDFQIELKDEASFQIWSKAMSDLDCVFLYSPYLRSKSIFAHHHPRWFYSLIETDIQKSLFLSSLGLESLAPLKGDFILIDTTTSRVSDPLISEMKRRKMILFFK